MLSRAIHCARVLKASCSLYAYHRGLKSVHQTDCLRDATHTNALAENRFEFWINFARQKSVWRQYQIIALIVQNLSHW